MLLYLLGFFGDLKSSLFLIHYTSLWDLTGALWFIYSHAYCVVWGTLIFWGRLQGLFDSHTLIPVASSWGTSRAL